MITEPAETTLVAPSPSGLLRRPPRNFVGRQTECEQCIRELLVRPAEGGRLIVSIAGVAGIGKTTLLQRLAQLAMPGTISVWVDERARISTAAGLARSCVQQLGRALGPDSQCARLLKAREVQEDVAVLTEAFIRDVNAAECQVVLILDTYEVVRSVACDWLLDYLLSGYLHPITGDLRLVISGREPLQRTDQRWVRDWDTMILNINLQPFVLSEIEAFLRGGPDTTSTSLAPTVEEIARAAHVTGGLPVWLGLWRQNWIRGQHAPAVVSAEDVQNVVERFLMWWPDARQRAWVRGAWISRWFNLELLHVVLGDEAEAAFDWLTQQASIVSGTGGRWSYHGIVRTALRHEAQQRSPGDLQTHHDTFAEYWASQPAADGTPDVERVYHQLLGSHPREGITAAYSAYLSTLVHARSSCDAVVDAICQARDEAGGSLVYLDPIEFHWDATQAGLPARRQLVAARNQILALGVLEPAERAVLLAERIEHETETTGADAAAPALPRRSRSSVAWWRRLFDRAPRSALDWDGPAVQRAGYLVDYGDSLRLAGDYEAALIALGQALELEPRHPRAHASRGEVLRVMGRLDEAIDELSAAAESAPTEPWIWCSRASAFLANREWDRALGDAERALALERNNPVALAVGGVALAHAARAPVPEAIASIKRALELDPSLEWARQTLVAWGQVEEGI